MATPILATKLFAPPHRPKIVTRPRLIERLNASLALGCKLSLIAAPAGFGKTTLLSEWIGGCGRPVAWLSLDAGDGDPVRFISYLVAAIQTIKPAIGAGVQPALQSAQAPQAEAALTTLLNDLAADPAGFVLVLDDYQVLDARPIDAAVEFLLEHLPAQMHLVIATREDLRVPLARLRAQGELIELRAADLRFTMAEVAEFLNRVMGLELSSDDIAALEARTEGWIAGLQMAAISMRGHDDASGFIRSLTGSHRFVLDYLIEEVLQRQPEHIQDFLLRTSILDRMCGSLCDAVLLDSSTASQTILEHLEHANLFIVPLDSVRRWYRYHHLFRDLLRQRLNHPRELREYHLRASAWLEANSDLSQAFHHALEGGDIERAVRLAEAAWQGMEHSFQTSAWLGWIKQLPDEAVIRHPGLCVQIGWAFSEVGETERSETYLRAAEQSLAGQSVLNGRESMLANIALIRAGNAQNVGNLSETVRYAELSLRLATENDVMLRSQAAITLGFTHWVSGRVEASLHAMRAWMDDMRRMDNRMYVIASAFALADMLTILGRLREAGDALHQSIDEARAFGAEAEPVTAHHHLGLAMLARERGDAAAFANAWDTAARLGQRTTLIDWPYRWNLAQARLREAEGNWESALEFLDSAARAYVRNPIPLLQPIDSRKARIYLKQGRTDKAQSWARERGLSATGKASYLAEFDHLTLARVRMAEGDLSAIPELLGRLLTLAESQQRAGSVVEILITLALVHHAQGASHLAVAALERALTITMPETWIQVFVDEGDAMRALIVAHRQTISIRARHLLGHMDRILAYFPKAAEAGRSSKPAPLKSALVESLTDRELEILRLIAAGRSNAEIGQQLYLALSTVKGHNMRLFGKLQAQNRTDAVARARKLGLL